MLETQLESNLANATKKCKTTPQWGIIDNLVNKLVGK